jgi:cell division protein FtsB
MRLIIVILVLALIGLQYKLWCGDSSIIQWANIEQKLKLQNEKNAKLTERNRIIEADISLLKSNENSLEEQARFELGMIKKGESYYQFVD